MNKEISEIKSISELKELSKKKGGFNQLKKIVRKEIFISKNTFTSFDGLFKFLKSFNTTYHQCAFQDEFVDDYFISKSAKYIYALVELDTDKRAKALGITQEHYKQLNMAKEWKRNIAKEIHPDKCSHPKAADAMSKLNDFYRNMVKYGE